MAFNLTIVLSTMVAQLVMILVTQTGISFVMWRLINFVFLSTQKCFRQVSDDANDILKDMVMTMFSRTRRTPAKYTRRLHPKNLKFHTKTSIDLFDSK